MRDGTTTATKMQALVVGLITMFGLAPIASAGASTADDAAVSQGADEPAEVGAQPMDGDGEERENVTIRVMKHVCTPSVQNIDDFESVDPNGDGQTTFADKVLACPTVVQPGDEYVDGAVSFDDKHEMQFEIEDENGDVHTIEDATFQQQQVCESEDASEDEDAATAALGADVSGDGDQDDCLDTSLYVYEGVADGEVTVTETQTPGLTEPGALEFTPQALNPNNDADTLLEEENEVFADDNMVELRTTEDDNGAITLHLYNFAVCPTVTATANDGPTNRLSWSAVDEADSYHVYRATADGEMEQIATVDGNTTTFDDGDVEEDVTYRYQVTAMVDGEETEACNTAEVTAIPVFSSGAAVASAAVLGIGVYAATRRTS
ncbi:hypothetical protein BRD56_11770 [Thermoplasmatales archaeon SW_10_69_26]|nr:MAG: hypothetical protein BRD56_11770 [Thermoplasmatales archaeon SW_10_69_26]